MIRWLFGSDNTPSKRYLIPGRLEDVLALIQVLAMDEFVNRGENGLQKELVGKPISAESWLEVARQHREFFRVTEGNNPSAVLIARYYAPSRKGEDELKLDSWLIRGLLDAAIQIHAGQLQRQRVLRGGLLGGAVGAIGVALLQFLAQYFLKK